MSSSGLGTKGFYGVGIVPSPASLSITRIPQYGLEELSEAINLAIYWIQRVPISMEEDLQRGEAFVKLMQSRWHVAQALRMLDRAA